MDELFNSREIAIAIWLTAFIVFVAYFKTVRKSAGDVLRAFFTPKLFIPLVLSFLPTAVVIGILAHFGLWDLSVLKETLYWVIGTGLVMFANSMKVQDVKTLFINTTKDTLKLIIILEFIINFYVFPLWAELIIIPFTTLVIMMSTVAKYQKGKEYELTKKFLNGLIVAIGLFITLFAIIELVNNPKPLFTYQNLELFLLPILLSFTYLPSVYLLALYSKYELVFNRIDHFLGSHINKKYTLKIACIKRCGLSVHLAGEMIRHLAINLNNETTKAEALKLIKDFKPS